MKKLKCFKILVCFILPIKLFAVDYYVSNSGNDANNGLTTSTAWATLTKVNSFTFAANDRVLFQRGSTWYGSLIINRNNITIDAYGSGNNPLITGYTLAGTWGNNVAGVWQVATTAKVNLNNITVDGIQVAKGRYPNTGFLNYEAIGNLSITDNQLTGSPNWSGAKAVIRKVRWIYDVCTITSHSGSTLNYTNPTDIDNVYPGIANFGYFIQDDARTLDVSGEWFLNKTTKVLSMYFGSTQNGVVKYSTVDTVINCGAFANITINNIAVEGSNVYGIYAKNGNSVTVNNCTLNNNGGTGIYVWNIPNCNITNNTITNNLGNGIYCNNSIATPTLIQGNSINKAGYMYGMGGNGDNKNNGIWQNGNGANIELNTIQNTGYNGIQYQGNNVTVNKNFINTYCTLADDGGGIYSWARNGLDVYSNRAVTNNIVLNGIGAGLGTDKPTSNDARGLYCDGGTNNVYFYNNTIINADAGAYLNNTVNVMLRSNTFFNVPIGISMQRFNNTQQLRTTDIKANIFYPTTSNLFYWNARLNNPPITIQNDLKQLGIIDSNTYIAGIVDEFDWYYHQNADSIPDGFTDPPSLNFAAWQFYTQHDAHSSTYTGTFLPFYNNTNATVVTALSGTWQDVYGTNYTSYTLQPFSSILLRQISAPIVEDNLLILRGVKFY
jgi:parallel beta-helix repeat protein